MNEPVGLLHNMSAPPKSVVRYNGLAGLVQQVGPGGSGVTSLRYRNSEQHGEAIRFELPVDFGVDSPTDILQGLGLQYENARDGAAARHLIQLINKRATELPLPEGCAVVKSLQTHSQRWPDPLAAIAALTKCTDTVWLRGKAPTLSNLTHRRSVSLLVPPDFLEQLKKAIS